MPLLYHHNLALCNIKSLKDRRSKQCYELFDSVVSNTAHLLRHQLPPKNIGRYNFRNQPNFKLQKCELIVTRTHLLHQCPVGKPRMRSVFYTVILYYMELFFFYKCVCNLKFFLNCHALH